MFDSNGIESHSYIPHNSHPSWINKYNKNDYFVENLANIIYTYIDKILISMQISLIGCIIFHNPNQTYGVINTNGCKGILNRMMISETTRIIWFSPKYRKPSYIRRGPLEMSFSPSAKRLKIILAEFSNKYTLLLYIYYLI